MAVPTPIGREAAVVKYDIITALTVWAYRQPKRVTNSVLRLIGIITARYNWQRDELSVGREWLADFWQVDTSTAKREMKRLREMGLISLTTAGVRGRVSRYRLEREAIMRLVHPIGHHVGPDFVDRIQTHAPMATETPAAGQGAGNVVPFERPAQTAMDRPEDLGDDTRQFHADLQRDDPAMYKAWFSAAKIERCGGQVRVVFNSAYRATYVGTHHHRSVARICARLWPGDSPVEITWQD